MRVVRHDPGAEPPRFGDLLPVGTEGKIWRYEPAEGDDSARRCWYVCADGEGWGWHAADELEHT